LPSIAWVATAAAESGPRQGQFYFSGLGAYYGPPDDYHLEDTWGWGGALGWAFHDQWSAEIEYFYTEPDLEDADDNAEVDTLWLNFLYKLPVDSDWQPYATFGFGASDYEADSTSFHKTDTNQANVGLGLFRNLGDHFALRADVRGVWHDEGNDISPFATVGLTLFLGGTPRVTDSDGDGVDDKLDKCPGTPAGRVVDANGCERDSDGDGVVDGVDQCPNTPAGVNVDSRGCPPDSDGDGVTDDKDQCPNTPRGTRVDARGCPEAVPEAVTFNLTVEFAFNSAVINEIGVKDLFNAIRFLREHPNTVAEIEGHTDSVGSDDYNQGLSERRADAIKLAIVNSGIDASRLSTVGYGESRPIATNDTDEGRQKNRRVLITATEAKR
jgi:OOP family OmpA-OmpF porin